ncbi:MAG: glycosyl hydrolase family 28-related protein [Streptosporangiaceae bacterium]
MTLLHYSSTAVPTTLAGSASSTAGTISVVAVTGFPSDYPYKLLLDWGSFAGGAEQEVVLVTAGSATSLTVTRGYDGTSASGHDAGAVVVHGVSAGDFGLGPADWINVVTQYGADPTGAADSTTAFENALAAAPAGAVVYVAAGVYLISAQLTIPAKVWLVGAQGYRAAAADFSRLRAASGFSASSLLTFGTGTPCGGAKYLSLDGALLASGNTVDGIDIIGPAKQGSLIGIDVKNFGGHGINIAVNANGNPDGWLLQEISSSNNGGHGVYWQYSVDGQMDVAHLDNNALSGLALLSLNNTAIANVKCQQNTQYGYFVTTAAGVQKAGASFIGCYSENNGDEGWYVTGSGGNSGAISWVGCWTRDDGTAGTNGSGYAGWYVDLPAVDLAWVGSGNYVTSSTAGPDYGVNLAGCTGNVSFAACSLIGAVRGYQDGGGNSTPSWFGTTLSAGQSDSRTASLPGLDTPGPALGQPKPSDFGAIAETYQYVSSTTGSAGQTPTAGVVVLAAISIPRPVTGSITLTFETTAAGATPTTGENLIGLYSPAGGAAVASAVIDSAVTASQGPQSFTLTLASPLTPGVYWVGLLFNAATVPTLRRAPVIDTAMLNFGAGVANSRAGTYGTAQTALPSVTPGSISQVNYLIYVRAS